MCRWLAYSGSPVLLEDLLYKPANSLVVQSQHSQLGATTINGDGFGVGWYGSMETPGLFRSTEPAWNDRNLRELCAHAKAAPRLRPHPGLDRHGRAADQLPPLPARELALDAQRGARRLPHDQARPGHGGGAGAVPRHRGLDRLGDVLPPRADLRAAGRPGRRVARAVGFIEASAGSTASSSRSR